jgi:ribosomally synthesized peptide (two-chain TOMM family)
MGRTNKKEPLSRGTEGGYATYGKLGGDYNPAVLAASQHWAIVWIRAIAKAWSDPNFKNKLLNTATTRDAFETDLNYQLNEGLDLEVRESKGAYAPGNPDPWQGLQKHKLIMYLPPAPPVAQRAIALAEYADTGRTYPFTSL